VFYQNDVEISGPSVPPTDIARIRLAQNLFVG
jgi:hypothetical protein